ncbi:MAG: glycoside hydrolase family 3 C-terminal domain-containing protein [Bacteroidales bacterium]|nr:glycoside hydrolase family 3 C-terminal domain-containing protein [Bacteroidales bacterium]
MKNHQLLLILCCIMLILSCSKQPDYKNKNLSPEKRAQDLLRLMTLDEKLMQMQCMWRGEIGKTTIFTNGEFDIEKARKVLPDGIGFLARLNEDLGPDATGFHPTLSPKEAAIQYNKIQKFFVEETRLGIPVISHEEGLHGQQSQDATSFPVPMSLASSWNEKLISDVFSIVAKEIRYRGGHQALAPVVDVVRDPRWGRTEETMGEDPFLISRLGVAQVKAYQGDGIYIDGDHVAATLKHFGVHGQPEGGNNTAPSFMDERVAREVFFKPFLACIREAGVMNVMVTYNELWGIPAHANKRLLKDILRNEMGFKGLVVADYYAISDLKNVNMVAPSMAEAGLMAFKAGIDVELPDMEGFKYLKEYVAAGKIKEKEIDQTVLRILTEKFRLGLFENPYVDPEKAEQFTGCEANRKVVYRAACESMVLLKNENNFLPLDSNKVKTIALIGPNADRCILGGYSSTPKVCISPLQAIKERYGNKIKVLYSEGIKITDVNSPFPLDIRLVPQAENEKRISEAIETARKADVVVLFVGANEATSREGYATSAPGDLPTLDLLNGQNELIDRIVALGKPTCAFVNSGPPLSIGHLAEVVPAVMQCWFLGQEGGYAMADALFGKINPSGKLPISFPRSAGHIPAYYSYKPSSRRGYNLGLDVSPLFSFGYGLSYTTFEYSNLIISDTIMKADGQVSVRIDVKNTGKRTGAEVVQMYIQDDYSSISRPIKELKGFKKIWLDPGQSETVTFTITPDLLAYYDINYNWKVEPGDFTIMVGPSSARNDKVQLTVK